ncbi:hypothetical protein [Klebsiella aerogenes]|uniref:hypothetical protein n=1 Tax=Klebsiella aerogenes TaxID=548 RepID=UPI0034D186A3
MDIKHAHIEMTLRSWRTQQKPEEIARLIAQELHKLDSGTSLLANPEAPGARHNNCQKIFRAESGWINGYTVAQRSKMRALLPAIERALLEDGKPRLLAQMRSYSSEPFRELVDRTTRIDSEVDALFGVMLSMSERHYGGGPAGNNLYH